MKHQLPLFSSSTFSSDQHSNAREIIEHFAALSSQHAALTEKLRELNNQAPMHTVAQKKWQDLKNQVVNLRCEIESFKQIF